MGHCRAKDEIGDCAAERLMTEQVARSTLCDLVYLTGLRPSPTRHAFGRRWFGGSGRRVKSVTGIPARCMNPS